MHHSTIYTVTVASGTHEVGKILIATGKHQRNPWVATPKTYPEVGRLR